MSKILICSCDISKSRPMPGSQSALNTCLLSEFMAWKSSHFSERVESPWHMTTILFNVAGNILETNTAYQERPSWEWGGGKKGLSGVSGLQWSLEGYLGIGQGKSGCKALILMATLGEASGGTWRSSAHSSVSSLQPGLPSSMQLAPSPQSLRS